MRSNAGMANRQGDVDWHEAQVSVLPVNTYGLAWLGLAWLGLAWPGLDPIFTLNNRFFLTILFSSFTKSITIAVTSSVQSCLCFLPFKRQSTCPKQCNAVTMQRNTCMGVLDRIVFTCWLLIS